MIHQEIEALLQQQATAPFGGLVGVKLINVLEINLNRTTRHSYTQAASCESAASEVSAVCRASTAVVTSGV